MGQYDDVDLDYATGDQLRGMLDELAAENLALKKQAKTAVTTTGQVSSPSMTTEQALVALAALRDGLARGQDDGTYFQKMAEIAAKAGLPLPMDRHSRWR